MSNYNPLSDPTLRAGYTPRPASSSLPSASPRSCISDLGPSTAPIVKQSSPRWLLFSLTSGPSAIGDYTGYPVILDEFACRGSVIAEMTAIKDQELPFPSIRTRSRMAHGGPHLMAFGETCIVEGYHYQMLDGRQRTLWVQPLRSFVRRGREVKSFVEELALEENMEMVGDEWRVAWGADPTYASEDEEQSTGSERLDPRAKSFSPGSDADTSEQDEVNPGEEADQTGPSAGSETYPWTPYFGVCESCRRQGAARRADQELEIIDSYLDDCEDAARPLDPRPRDAESDIDDSAEDRQRPDPVPEDNVDHIDDSEWNAEDARLEFVQATAARGAGTTMQQNQDETASVAESASSTEVDADNDEHSSTTSADLLAPEDDSTSNPSTSSVTKEHADGSESTETAKEDDTKSINMLSDSASTSTSTEAETLQLYAPADDVGAVARMRTVLEELSGNADHELPAVPSVAAAVHEDASIASTSNGTEDAAGSESEETTPMSDDADSEAVASCSTAPATSVDTAAVQADTRSEQAQAVPQVQAVLKEVNRDTDCEPSETPVEITESKPSSWAAMAARGNPAKENIAIRAKAAQAPVGSTSSAVGDAPKYAPVEDGTPRVPQGPPRRQQTQGILVAGLGVSVVRAGDAA